MQLPTYGIPPVLFEHRVDPGSTDQKLSTWLADNANNIAMWPDGAAEYDTAVQAEEAAWKEHAAAHGERP